MKRRRKTAGFLTNCLEAYKFYKPSQRRRIAPVNPNIWALLHNSTRNSL